MNRIWNCVILLWVVLVVLQIRDFLFHVKKLFIPNFKVASAKILTTGSEYSLIYNQVISTLMSFEQLQEEWNILFIFQLRGRWQWWRFLLCHCLVRREVAWDPCPVSSRDLSGHSQGQSYSRIRFWTISLQGGFFWSSHKEHSCKSNSYRWVFKKNLFSLFIKNYFSIIYTCNLTFAIPYFLIKKINFRYHLNNSTSGKLFLICTKCVFLLSLNN